MYLACANHVEKNYSREHSSNIVVLEISVVAGMKKFAGSWSENYINGKRHEASTCKKDLEKRFSVYQHNIEPVGSASG